MVGYKDGLHEIIVREGSLARARWLAALGPALDAVAVTVLVAVIARTTVMGEERTPPGLIGAVAGLAISRVFRMIRGERPSGRRARLMAMLYGLLRALASAAVFYALDRAVFP